MPTLDWTTVRKLVEAVRQVPACERLEFLKKECGDQETLFDEVLSLLEHEDRAESFLEPPAAAEVAPLFREHQAAGYIGETIGPFEITGLLGYGGMGVVLRARQANPPREVALKIVRGGSFVDKRQLRLFEREIRSLARLSHPAIASLYEAGCTDDGQHYFAMELVEGEPITISARNNDLPVDRRLALFCQLCEAIHYAHQRGVIHRDLKPSNVLITADARVKVLDFGLAKITDSDVTATSIVAKGDKVEGTAAYMSPEQARGAGEEIDVRSDVYSLGVVLYELLTDRLPYNMGSHLAEMIRQVCEESPIPPSTVRRSLRGDLETIVLKAMEKEPQRRYQGANALAEDIERFLHQQPIIARPPSAVYQIRKLVARHKVSFAFGMLLLAVIIGSGVVAGALSIRLARERELAVAATQSETAARKSAEQVVDFLVKLFEQGSPNAPEKTEPTVRELVDASVIHVKTELADQPLVQARLMIALGQVYMHLREFREARELLETALETRERELGAEHDDVAESLFVLSGLFMATGEGPQAKELALRALELRRRIFGEEHARYADALEEVGSNLFYEGDVKTAIDFFRRSLDRKRKLYGEQNLEVASALQNLGLALNALNELDESEALLRRALAIKRDMKAPPIKIVMAMDAVAHIPFRRGDNVETERLLKEEVDYARANLRRGHGWIDFCTDNYATVILQHRGAEQADPIYREGLRIARDSGGNLVQYLRALAHVRKQLKDYAEAELLYSEALEIRRLRFGDKHQFVAESARELGVVLVELQRFEAAETLLLESFGICSAALGVDHKGTVNLIEDIAGLYDAWQKPQEASAWRQKLGGPALGGPETQSR